MVLRNKHSKKHSKKTKHSKKHSKKTKHSNTNQLNLNLYKNGSGTRLLVMPNRSETESSSIYFYFKVGSKNETPDINGVSHFIEHMLFKGSPNYPNYLDISKTFDSNGISFNAYTSKDITAYHYKFLSTQENLDLICKITSDMLFKSLMREKDIGPERNVIIQEYNDGIDDIDEYIDDKLEECLFEGHPLGMSIIGTLDTLHKINRKKMMDYYHKHYTPENLLIGFNGKLASGYMSIIEKYFKGKGSSGSSGSSGSTHRFAPIQMKNYVPGESLMIPFTDKYPSYKINCYPKELSQDYINIIFKTRGHFDPNRYYYKLISNILGGNMSSRLFVEIREKLGLAYSIKTDITNYEEVGFFNIYTQNETKDTVKCIEHIFKELVKLKKEGIDETELKNNKKNYCDIYKTNFDDIEYENEFYSNQILLNKPLESPQMRVKKIQEITCNQICDASNELFNFSKVHIITFGDIKKDKIEKIIKKYL
jgi:predicted Zn-dependent peptidase